MPFTLELSLPKFALLNLNILALPLFYTLPHLVITVSYALFDLHLCYEVSIIGDDQV